MAPASSSSTATTSVQVALRIRPPTTQDNNSIPARFQRSVIQTTSSTSVSIESPNAALAGTGTPAVTSSPSSAPKKQVFTFDQVHPPPTTQYEMFTSTAQPLVSRFLDGYNCTILAYGQTSSGKTFTMTGVDLDADPSDPDNGMGIIPRAVSTVFARAKQLKEERVGAWNYSIKGSFIEIYNEDLIDLLSMDDSTGGRREVQIREDKDGHIIWGGLREVAVKNPNEVMSLIRKGTAIRRTNETDMNAQSSRSHAIFSLTLTQKKYTGSGAPARSPSPLPPGGRSPSRLARPGSMFAGGAGRGDRVGSPTFGRPSTPSFASAIGRGGGLRPASALGHFGGSTASQDDDGEWVTIVSKFHFVDLAGSERLKRTAAAGERIKEGISINSGLLALGNVISALGDPARAKSNTATHVPYRDSKLTRLLQDSLGGNAHTLMIACVSPAEWNAGETINTLKYANRARNIKNRAVVNEKENGWDDIEWLQGTVTRLRKEVKILKDGGGLPSADRESDGVEGASKRLLVQLTDLQNNYEGLSEKFVERTEELTRLRRELGEKHRTGGSGAIGGTAKYEEIVGPVIEEYEKTIATIEAELSLNRAALRHTNEMMEEKEEELSDLSERHAATEMYVGELRARVAKLSEREASTEAYVRDLEEKVKAYDENSTSSSESLLDLKREIARYKDAEAYSSKYITDLETRLARTDESVIGLQRTVEQLEGECERRRDEVDSLQGRLDALRRDGESWRVDLEERERKVRELEGKMEEWERKKKEAGEARVRLGNVVERVESARKSLEADVEADVSVTPPTPPSPTREGASELPEPQYISGSRPPSPIQKDTMLQSQLLALQETHTATLADLSSITAKYRDALREISDLAGQLQEAKLNSNNIIESVSESPASDKPMDIPPIRRRAASSRARDVSDLQLNSSGRRLFFRQAASAESLHARSQSQSQSLSQELSSAHLRKTSFSSQGTSSSHSPSNSHSTLHSVSSRPNLSVSLPGISPGYSNERSVSSLEKEIMRLQEVLKEREAEISVLEASLMESQNDKLNPPPVAGDNPESTPATNGDVLENGSTNSDPDESLERLNELMLSMAQKESHHKEVVEDLTTQLTQTKRQLDDLTTLSRDQAHNISKEIEVLQGKHQGVLDQLERLRGREADLENSLKEAEIKHHEEIEKLRIEHEEALKSKGSEVNDLTNRLNDGHDATTVNLRNELQEASAALEKAHQEHETAFGKLKAEYESELQRQLQDADSALALAHEEHEKALAKVHSDHVVALRQKDEEHNSSLQTTEEQYYNALIKLRGDHAEAIKKLTAETNATIERLREEHAGELRMAEIAKEGSISESEVSRSVALKGLQDEHASAIARKEASFAEDLGNLKAGHIRELQSKDDDYRLQLDRLRLENETIISKLKGEWRSEVDGLGSIMSAEREEREETLRQRTIEHDDALQKVQEQNSAILHELERSHEEELTKSKELHDRAVHELLAKAEQERSALNAAHEEDIYALKKSHTELVLQLKGEHESAVKDLDGSIVAIKEQHIQALADLRGQNTEALAEAKERLLATVDDLQSQHSQEKDILKKDYDLLLEELEAYKSASEEFTLLREQYLQSHEEEIGEKSTIIQDVTRQLSSVTSERDELHGEVEKLRAELDKTRSEQSKLIQEASKRDSLVMELEQQRSSAAELQENLQKVKDEKDALQTEKNRSDSLVRELQAQIARSASPPHIRSPDRSVGFSRATGLTAIKLPPPTPPPSVPPPPAPRSATSPHMNGDSFSASSQSSTMFSRESMPESPSTSATPLTPAGPTPLDPKVSTQLEQQAKQIEEQEAMIKTLNKQLTHCEADLQSHIEMVTNLENSLGDSEKNLRGARMRATELARERDALNTRIESLRNELSEAKREVVTVRRSIVEEKQSLEQRLDEERKAKERARQQLDSRMEELQRRKSKFACL
ncbi:kinesin domain-containing protein [Cyathus striatus]|nr:kinesin domain-containing protein [Cyathus striatus]